MGSEIIDASTEMSLWAVCQSDRVRVVCALNVALIGAANNVW